MSNERKNKDIITPIVIPAYFETESTKKKGIVARLKGTKFKRKPKEQRIKTIKKKEKVLRQTPGIVPFLQIHEEYIVMKKGVMDIFQITTKDLYSLNEIDLQFLLLSQARFLRSYFPAYKEVALNFPSNTEKQKVYWLKKKEETTDLLRLQFIERKLFELEFLEKERTNREFFLFIYAKDQQQLQDRKKHIIRMMQQSFPLKKMSIEKKLDVLFMLNNQNSKL